MKRENKSGISPVVATVLLIMMVVVIALIIFLWFKNISGEVITKDGDENIKLSCDKVKLEASHSANYLYIKNVGNVPISGMKIKVSGSGGSEKELVEGFSGLNSGATGRYSYTLDNPSDEITLFPVLLGKTSEGNKNYDCKNGILVE